MSDEKQRLDPASILIYGKSKIGKTGQFVNAFGPRALWVVLERGAMNTAFNPVVNPHKHDGRIILPRDVAKERANGRPTLDYVVATSSTNAYGELKDIIKKYVVPGVKDERYRAVVLDGFSEWVDRVWGPIAANINSRENAHGKGFTSNLYPKVRDILRECMDLGAWVGAVAHERPPSEFEGRMRAGAPAVVGAMAEDTPKFFDLVLRMVIGKDASGKRDRLFKCDPLDPSWITGERFGVCAESEPANLRLLLKRIGQRQRGEEVEMPVAPEVEELTLQ